jgi:hypothetical protein
VRTPFLLLALAVVALATPSCSDDASSRPAASDPHPDVAAAVDRTLAAGSGLADLTLRFEDPAARTVVARGDGGFDLAHGRRWLRLDLGPLVAAAGGAGAGLARAGTVVDGDHVWVLRPGGGWVHVEATGAAATEPFASAGPEALLASLRDVEDGRLVLREGALPGVPAGGRDTAVDVDVDRAGRLRRVVLRPELPSGSLTVTVDFRRLGAPVAVPVPPPDAVTDAPVG